MRPKEIFSCVNIYNLISSIKFHFSLVYDAKFRTHIYPQSFLNCAQLKTCKNYYMSSVVRGKDGGNAIKNRRLI